MDRCESVIFSGELNCHETCLWHMCWSNEACRQEKKGKAEFLCRSEQFKQYDWRYRLKYCNETIDRESYNYSETNIVHLDRLVELTKEPVEFENVYKVYKTALFLFNELLFDNIQLMFRKMRVF